MTEIIREGGVWVSYLYDANAQITAAHAFEIDALRYALDNHNSGVIFLPYGISLSEALEAKDKDRSSIVESRRRLKECVDAWPECVDGGYDPRCCRFPKCCAASSYSEEHITDDQLESDGST